MRVFKNIFVCIILFLATAFILAVQFDIFPLYGLKIRKVESLKKIIGEKGDAKVYRFAFKEYMKFIFGDRDVSSPDLREYERYYCYSVAPLLEKSYHDEVLSIYKQYYIKQFNRFTYRQKIRFLEVLPPNIKDEDFLQLLLEEYKKDTEAKGLLLNSIVKINLPASKVFTLEEFPALKDIDIEQFYLIFYNLMTLHDLEETDIQKIHNFAVNLEDTNKRGTIFDLLNQYHPEFIRKHTQPTPDVPSQEGTRTEYPLSH